MRHSRVDDGSDPCVAGRCRLICLALRFAQLHSLVRKKRGNGLTVYRSSKVAYSKVMQTRTLKAVMALPMMLLFSLLLLLPVLYVVAAARNRDVRVSTPLSRRIHVDDWFLTTSVHYVIQMMSYCWR